MLEKKEENVLTPETITDSLNKTVTSLDDIAKEVNAVDNKDPRNIIVVITEIGRAHV